MPFSRNPHPESLKSLTDVSYMPYWLDDPRRPEAAPALQEKISADLVIIGAGFTGLWAAFLAKKAHPERAVVLLEAGRVADGASGRNGGFVEASLTHGFENGLRRWPEEIGLLTKLGHANLTGIEDTVKDLQIDCDFQRSGELTVATEPYQVEDLRDAPAEAAVYGEEWQWLERDEVQARVNSPTYLGALYDPSAALTNPARLAWGLRQACLDLGVQLYENTPVSGLEQAGKHLLVRVAGDQTPGASLHANQVALATNAFPPLLKGLQNFVLPVYDYVLVSEPLSNAQWASLGWQQRHGISDSGNQFHYYRPTADGRILWGGYDAVYYPNNGFGPHLERNQEAFGRLADHFFATFPQLAGLRFTHAWGGAIDTCSRFSAFWGTTHRGRTAYVLGYTGLGVGASRFGAQVMLALLDGEQNELTRLQMVRSRPLPFPPEPLRSLVVRKTQRSLDRADHEQGRRDLWLRLLDALGLGFDS